ncbi:MAG: CcmD family protein [Cyclobacteriaceae bacterium]|nr:CcmD family protein [Cyclobacteriaceae bacterium]
MLAGAFIHILAFFSFAQAQDTIDNSIEMADQMRADGKIYVVVLVVLIAFTGLMVYAISTDRKVSKLENEIKSLKSKEDL